MFRFVIVLTQWLMIQVLRRREQSHVPQASRARGPTHTQDCPVVPLPWRRAQTKPSWLTMTQNARTTQCFPVRFVNIFIFVTKQQYLQQTDMCVFCSRWDAILYTHGHEWRQYLPHSLQRRCHRRQLSHLPVCVYGTWPFFRPKQFFILYSQKRT